MNLLVEYKASGESTTAESQETALHYAAKHGHKQLAARLIELGSNPNARDKNGRSPLHVAAEVWENSIELYDINCTKDFIFERCCIRNQATNYVIIVCRTISRRL